MNRKWMWTSAAAVGGVLLVSGAWAAGEAGIPGPVHRMRAGAFAGGEQRPMHRFMTGQIGRMMVLKSEMNITDEQREKIRAVVESHKAQITPVAKSLATQGRALRDAVASDKSDEKSIRAAAGELSKSIGDAAVIAATIRAEVRPILTEEQRKSLEGFRAESDKAMDRMIEEITSKAGTPQ